MSAGPAPSRPTSRSTSSTASRSRRSTSASPVLYAQTETGNVNSYIHVWAYKDAADRAQRRAAMQADPGWIDYVKRSGEAGYLQSQHNQLMTPVSFFKPN